MNDTSATLRTLFEQHRNQKARPGSALDDLTRNPNTPPDVLELLLARLPASFCANPAAPLLLLEDPGVIGRRHPERLLRALREPNTPRWFVEAIAIHPAPSVREAARQHVALEPDISVEGWLQENLSPRSRTLRRWWREGRAPSWLLERFGWKFVDEVPRPMDFWNWRDERRGCTPGQRCVLASSLTDPTAIRAAARSHHPADRLGVALSPSVTRQRLHRLKRDASTLVRFAAMARLGDSEKLENK